MLAITIDDTAYQIIRILPPHSEEDGVKQIHEYLETDVVARNQRGEWVLCKKIQDATCTPVVDGQVESETISENSIQLVENTSDNI